MDPLGPTGNFEANIAFVSDDVDDVKRAWVAGPAWRFRDMDPSGSPAEILLAQMVAASGAPVGKQPVTGMERPVESRHSYHWGLCAKRRHSLRILGMVKVRRPRPEPRRLADVGHLGFAHL